MPLPNNPKMAMPPRGPIYASYMEHDAWYSANPERIAAVYANILVPGGRGLGERIFGNIEGNFSSFEKRSMFWAKGHFEERKTMLHIPVANDISSTSASLLFGEPPKNRIPEAYEEKASNDAKSSQNRLEEIIQKSGFINKLLEAAETSSALGGVFIKPVWDRELANYPMISVDQADQAIPEFRWGILTAVTFFKAVKEEDEVVWWLIERHEKGVILTGLYKGNADELGYQVDLKNLPETEHIMPVIPTHVNGILPRYIPNMKPNNRFRGSDFGKSDYIGTEGMMDALDEVWSSWMTDIRLGKGRIIVPEHFLEKDPRTGRLKFDTDREVFTTLDADPISAKEMGITANQFNIRTEEHSKTAIELIERIVSTAGYSPQSFGLKIEGRAESGTALTIRERKSFMTKIKKESYWKSAIEDVMEMMLFIDNYHLGNRTTVFRPTVEFQDSIQNDLNQLAMSVEMINRAQAASIETKIRLLHPEWTEEQVKAEAALIKAQVGLSMPNPDDIGIS